MEDITTLLFLICSSTKALADILAPVEFGQVSRLCRFGLGICSERSRKDVNAKAKIMAVSTRIRLMHYARKEGMSRHELLYGNRWVQTSLRIQFNHLMYEAVLKDAPLERTIPFAKGALGFLKACQDMNFVELMCSAYNCKASCSFITFVPDKKQQTTSYRDCIAWSSLSSLIVWPDSKEYSSPWLGEI